MTSLKKKNQVENSRMKYFGSFKIPLPVYFLKIVYQQEHKFEGDFESPETQYFITFLFCTLLSLDKLLKAGRCFQGSK